MQGRHEFKNSNRIGCLKRNYSLTNVPVAATGIQSKVNQRWKLWRKPLKPASRYYDGT
jgi:hypothetical protein